MKNNIIVFLLLGLGAFSCNSTTNETNKHLKNAKDFLLQKNYVDGLKEVDISINLDSSNYESFFVKGKIKVDLELYEDAIILLKKVLSKNYKVDTVCYLLGQSYFELGQYYSFKKNDADKKNEYLNEAVTYHDKAINHNPGFFDVYIGKFKSLHNQNNFAEALITINKALNLFPDSIELISNRGIEKQFLGDKNEALKDLNFAIESKKLDSSNCATALRFRGRIYSEEGNFDQAIYDLTSAIQYDSKNAYLFSTRASFYRQKGLQDLACKDYRKAAELGMISIYETIKEYCDD